jgi:hypothetical protein
MKSLALIFAFTVISASVMAQPQKWDALKNKHLITFDWNCATTEAFPQQALGKLVKQALSHESRKDPNVYGERAVRIRLQSKGRFVCFVPIVCGATGNCTWRMYTTSPVKYLGEITGQYIYTYQSVSRMPTIVTYSHFNAAEGHLHTFQFRKRSFQWLGDSYPIGKIDLNGYDLPGFLKNAQPQCRDYGW